MYFSETTNSMECSLCDSMENVQICMPIVNPRWLSTKFIFFMSIRNWI